MPARRLSGILPDMPAAMKDRYGLFRRAWGVYYANDKLTGQPKSLKTTDHQKARRLVDALNEAEREVGIRKQIGLLYLSAADPQAAKRTWTEVMAASVQMAPPKSRHRWATVELSEPLVVIIALRTTITVRI